MGSGVSHLKFIIKFKGSWKRGSGFKGVFKGNIKTLNIKQSWREKWEIGGSLGNRGLLLHLSIKLTPEVGFESVVYRWKALFGLFLLNLPWRWSGAKYVVGNFSERQGHCFVDITASELWLKGKVLCFHLRTWFWGENYIKPNKMYL